MSVIPVGLNFEFGVISFGDDWGCFVDESIGWEIFAIAHRVDRLLRNIQFIV